MVAMISRKIQVILLLAVVMHGSLVIGMDGGDDKNATWLARAKKAISPYLPTRGTIFEYQAKVTPAFVGAFGFGGLFLAYKNNKLDDPKLLGSFATLATLATGATLYGAQGLTPQGQYDNCAKMLEELEKDSLLTEYAKINPNSNPQVLTCVYTAIQGSGTYVFDMAIKQVNDLEQKMKSLEAGIKSLGKLKDNPTPIKYGKDKENGYKTAANASESFSQKVKGLKSAINNLKLVIMNTANTTEAGLAKTAHVEQQKYQLLRTSIQSFAAAIAAGMSVYFGSYLVDKYSK